jgi:hypothetical protein
MSERPRNSQPVTVVESNKECADESLHIISNLHYAESGQRITSTSIAGPIRTMNKITYINWIQAWL